MSEQPAEPSSPDHDGTQGERLDRLEGKVDALVDAVSGLKLPTHAEAQRREETRLDRSSTVAQAVQDELARRDKQAADKRQADEDKAAKESTATRLAALEEQRPEPPLRRSTRFMWGDPRGR